jgi:hypothetical protein
VFQAGTELVVSARDDNYLHFIDFTKEELPVAEMNMNMLGDDWVSFAAMDVSYSPNDKYVLVSTGMCGRQLLLAALPIVTDMPIVPCADKDRIILYSRSTGKIVCLLVSPWPASVIGSHPERCVATGPQLLRRIQ